MSRHISISITAVHLFVSVWTWWIFALMSFCQVGLLFQQHYVWLSESNCLGVFQHAVSALDEEQVIVTESCQIYSVTKNFQTGAYSVNLCCSCKGLCSWRPFQGQFSGGTGRRGPGLLKGDLGALDSSVLSSPLEKFLPVQRACSVSLSDGAPHLCIDLVFSMELAACRKLLSVQRNGRA